MFKIEVRFKSRALNRVALVFSVNSWEVRSIAYIDLPKQPLLRLIIPSFGKGIVTGASRSQVIKMLSFSVTENAQFLLLNEFAKLNYQVYLLNK